MMPVRHTDSQLAEVMLAARTVPVDLRQAFLEALAVELRDRGNPLGDGVVHRLSYEVARRINWGAERSAAVG